MSTIPLRVRRRLFYAAVLVVWGCVAADLAVVASAQDHPDRWYCVATKLKGGQVKYITVRQNRTKNALMGATCVALAIGFISAWEDVRRGRRPFSGPD